MFSTPLCSKSVPVPLIQVFNDVKTIVASVTKRRWQNLSVLQNNFSIFSKKNIYCSHYVLQYQPDKIFHPSYFLTLFIQLLSDCFKALIQSSKMPETALVSLKNRSGLKDPPPDLSSLWRISPIGG